MEHHGCKVALGKKRPLDEAPLQLDTSALLPEVFSVSAPAGEFSVFPGKCPPLGWGVGVWVLTYREVPDWPGLMQMRTPHFLFDWSKKH